MRRSYHMIFVGVLNFVSTAILTDGTGTRYHTPRSKARLMRDSTDCRES